MPEINNSTASNELPIVPKQNYKVMVLLCKYKGATDSTNADGATAYEEFFYEINRGLTAINTSYQVNGQGSGSITISLPMDDAFESATKNIFDKVLVKWTADQVKGDWAKIDSTLRLDINENQTYTLPGNKIQESNARITEITNVNLTGKDISFYPMLDATKTQCVFTPMDKIRIYMEGRFSKSLFKTFEGLIQSTSVNFDGIGATITIQFTDLTRWLDISEYNINPALALNVVADRTGQKSVSVFNTNLAQKSPQEIVKTMVTGSTKPEKILLADATEYTNALKTNAADKLSVKILIVESDGTTVVDSFEYPEGSKTTNEIVEKKVSEMENYLSRGMFVITNYYVSTLSNTGCGYFYLAKVNENPQSGSPVEIMQNTGFEKDSLWIDPNLFTIAPYISKFRDFDLWQHQYVKRYQICMEVANRIEAEFFANPNGTIVFKMPSYGYNPGTVWAYKKVKTDGSLDPDNEEPFMPNGDFYLIEDKDIINYTFSEDDSDILNFLWVVGQAEYGIDLDVPGINKNIVFDANLIKKFGMRESTITIPFAAWQNDAEKRQQFGTAYMNRRNAKYKKGSMSIPLRPEIQIGQTIAIVSNQLSQKINLGKSIRGYVQSDESSIFYGKLFSSFLKNTIESEWNKKLVSNVLVYYITGMSHSWQVGGQPTTQITLGYGRYWEQEKDFASTLFTPKPYTGFYNKLLDSIIKDIDDLNTMIGKIFDAELKRADEDAGAYRNVQICYFTERILEQLKKLFVVFENRHAIDE
jgi:hypothetical protein